VPATFPLLPLLVFCAELCVVTISTIRIIFLSRGMKTLAAMLGFFEITIWLFAIGQIMRNLSDLGCYLGFASGFTLGNYFGVLIEKKLAIGTQVVRIITRRGARELVARLQAANYGVTILDAEGSTGPVKVIFTVIQRRQLAKVVGIIRGVQPQAFYSVEEVQEAAAGIFPLAPRRSWGVMPSVMRTVRRAAPVLAPVTFMK
jgi:uncharacterized protein YebE (UPF0316 family)